MGKAKKEKNRVAADKAAGKGSTPGLANVAHVKGTNFYRDAKKARTVQMYKDGKPTRNADGKIIKAASFQSRAPSGTMARVEPNRKWFGGTRTVGQLQLDAFRKAMADRKNDPYTVLLNPRNLPLSLLKDSEKISRMHILETDPFSNTFGPKAQRKRPRLSIGTVDDLASSVTDSLDKYSEVKDPNLLANISTEGVSDAVSDPIFGAGQSKRIWNELYKVLDSSDVVIHVLDARDPSGTRCKPVEKYLREEAKHKQLIFVLNKCDLVPTWVTARWVRHLSKTAPTLAFHASITNSFGKGSLIQLLRQFSQLHKDKKQISVGFIGYPNVGKSSIINTLRSKKVCNVAPIPGETKVWQYITLMKRIYLIDCPGVVAPAVDDKPVDIVLKGVVRVENLSQPEYYIPAVLERVRREYMGRTYEVKSWEDAEDFLGQVAKRTGKLLKGGEPDLGSVAKMVLNDWIRGRIPFYSTPPDLDGFEGAAEGGAAEEGQQQPVVQQIFSKIFVSAKYLPDDMTREGEVVDDPEVVRAVEEAEEGAKGEKKERKRKMESTDWDEVFESVVGEEVVDSIPGREGPVDVPESDDEEVEGEEEEVGGEGWESVEEGEEDAADAEDAVVDDDDEPLADSSEDEPESFQKRRKLTLQKGRRKAGLPVFTVQETPATTTTSPPKKRRTEPKSKPEPEYSDDEDQQSKKAARVTTNKGKVGKHYYETANVKNRNRSKVKPIDPNTLVKKLQKTGKVSGKVGKKGRR
ncbi:GTPase required for pre-60S ribosomal subunit nuclear export and maturation [Rhizophlyctis rosea]|uniref:Nucleolar GTP-binding protein 2 n=1 Tax=Rhizophlyctis rosea TaxID=64517 RepID=A0AAD5X6X2_9FUNG|nr:GTPase required for pre-60S ribosomal subunit nuclear export and maturation [Rhizophlyctis rosea]